jgi:carbonic anhydrase/acetyltransferase-like protein (isoleucine patch superfamily)
MIMPFLREYRGLRPRIGKNVYLADDVVLIGEVVLEDDVSVWWGSVLRGDCGKITVGRGTNIQDGCMIHATTDLSTVVLGPNATVGHHAIVHGATVQEGALVGMKSTLLDLAVVGAYSVVAAGAVVPERMEIPSDSLVAGVPARIKKKLPPQARHDRLARAQEYRDLAAYYLGQRLRSFAPE